MQHPRRSRPVTIGRRTFIAGAAAGALAACSGSDGSSTADGPVDPDSTDPGSDGSGRVVAAAYEGASEELDSDSFLLIQRYPVNQPNLVPGSVRLPFSLAGDDADFITDGPLVLGGQVVDLDGNPVGPRLEATRRDVTPSPYYAFAAQIEQTGIYSMVVDGGPSDGASFQVFAPDQVNVPRAGQPLPGVETPTDDDSRGVDPICTRDPACPFHTVTLSEALGTGKAVAYLIGTPALCQTGSCTPALEAMVEAATDYENIVFVHAEVWTDPTATVKAPAIDAYSMDYEPALFVTDPTGVIVRRLDAVWDVTELRESLDAARA